VESFVAAMRDGLRALGYAEPQTIAVDRLYADYDMKKVPSLVAELEPGCRPHRDARGRSSDYRSG
jgi:hypothetical protein